MGNTLQRIGSSEGERSGERKFENNIHTHSHLTHKEKQATQNQSKSGA